jgi:hypothetical protein
MRVRKIPKAAKKAVIDTGLQEIADWRTWFVSAHTQRLTDNGLEADAVARELVPIETLADAIVATMREQYLANARRTQP